MKIAGIIAEYNPFHNGHAYQIKKLKELGFDAIVVVMSGDFVQRGTPSAFDKYTRTAMALSHGVDCIFELPVIYSTASAEGFAKAGIGILEGLGCVSHIAFGAECQDINKLSAIAHALKNPGPAYEGRLLELQKEGFSFPLARAKALTECQLISDFSSEEIAEILKCPNNILAIEYLKATKLTPVLIPRIGNAYHETELGTYASASGIRSFLSQKPQDLSILKSALPEEAYSILKDAYQQNTYLEADDVSALLGYALLREEKADFASYLDCSSELSSKIKKQLPYYKDFTQFAALLKSKNLTSTRIQRLLLHILLGIHQEDAYPEAYYGRLLGFHKSSSSLLSAIKKEASIPMITKVADASHILNESQYKVFQKDLFASSLYNQLLFQKSGKEQKNDFARSPIMPE